MRYIVDDEIKFTIEELEVAKKYYYNDEKIDDYFIEKNNEIKNAETLDDIVKAYNSITDNYYSGASLMIYDTDTKKYIRY